MAGVRPGLFYVERLVHKEWKVFALKVAAWIGAALAAQFLMTIFLDGPLDYLVPGILVLGALQIGLLDRTPLPANGGRMLKRGIALLMVTFAVWFATGANGEEKIKWQPFSDELLEAARKGRRPVMIDFTSKACLPCLQMERNVFSNTRVGNAAKEFLPLRIDMTLATQTNAVLAERFNIQMFPTVLFIGGDGKERVNLRLEGYENARFFAERVERAR